MAVLDGAGRPFAVATVVRTQGSTPQTVGAKLVVTAPETERPTGTLGGGCVEADAILACREILAGGKRTLRGYSLAEDLAWNTGLVCGGTMWILAESREDAITIGSRNYLQDFVKAIDTGPPLAVATLLERHGRELAFAGRMIVRPDGHAIGSIGDVDRAKTAASEALRQLPHGTPRVMPLGESHELLVEPVVGKPRLVI